MAIRITRGVTTAVSYTPPTPHPWYLQGGIEANECVFAYGPEDADDLADSYINLVNPGTYDVAPGDAPSWSAAGWAFDGISNYLVTGAVPVMGAWTVLVLCDVDEYEAERRDIFGVTEGLLQKFGIHTEAGNTFFESGDSFEVVGVPALSVVIGFSGLVALLDGVAVGIIPAGSGVLTNDIEIGRGLVGGVTWERD